MIVKYKFIGIFLIINLILLIGFAFPKKDYDQLVNSVVINDTSKSSIVLDLYNNEVLYENNAYSKMLPASLTKVLTAYVAYIRKENGTHSLRLSSCKRRSTSSAYPIFTYSLNEGFVKM